MIREAVAEKIKAGYFGRYRIELTGIIGSLIVISGLIISVFPFLWIVLTSLKSRPETLAIPPTFFPREIIIRNYVEIWQARPFATYMANTILIAGTSTVIAVSSAALAGYAFARIHFPGKWVILFMILVAQMFPGPSIVVPIFDIINKLGLYNNRLGVIFLYATFVQPFSTWMLYGYFRKIPGEIEDAALIDGCSRMQVFLRIAVPLATPGLFAVGTYAFLVAWNEFLYAVLILSNPDLYTVSLGLARYIGEYSTYWDQMAAASVVAALPVLVVFFLLGRNLIDGLTAGAVKQ